MKKGNYEKEFNKRIKLKISSLNDSKIDFEYVPIKYKLIHEYDIHISSFFQIDNNNKKVIDILIIIFKENFSEKYNENNKCTDDFISEKIIILSSSYFGLKFPGIKIDNPILKFLSKFYIKIFPIYNHFSVEENNENEKNNFFYLFWNISHHFNIFKINLSLLKYEQIFKREFLPGTFLSIIDNQYENSITTPEEFKLYLNTKPGNKYYEVTLYEKKNEKIFNLLEKNFENLINLNRPLSSNNNGNMNWMEFKARKFIFYKNLFLIEAQKNNIFLMKFKKQKLKILTNIETEKANFFLSFLSQNTSSINFIVDEVDNISNSLIIKNYKTFEKENSVECELVQKISICVLNGDTDKKDKNIMIINIKNNQLGEYELFFVNNDNFIILFYEKEIIMLFNLKEQKQGKNLLMIENIYEIIFEDLNGIFFDFNIISDNITKNPEVLIIGLIFQGEFKKFVIPLKNSLKLKKKMNINVVLKHKDDVIEEKITGEEYFLDKRKIYEILNNQNIRNKSTNKDNEICHHEIFSKDINIENIEICKKYDYDECDHLLDEFKMNILQSNFYKMVNNFDNKNMKIDISKENQNNYFNLNYKQDYNSNFDYKNYLNNELHHNNFTNNIYKNKNHSFSLIDDYRCSKNDFKREKLLEDIEKEKIVNPKEISKIVKEYNICDEKIKWLNNSKDMIKINNEININDSLRSVGDTNCNNGINDLNKKILNKNEIIEKGDELTKENNLNECLYEEILYLNKEIKDKEKFSDIDMEKINRYDEIVIKSEKNKCEKDFSKNIRKKDILDDEDSILNKIDFYKSSKYIRKKSLKVKKKSLDLIYRKNIKYLSNKESIKINNKIKNNINFNNRDNLSCNKEKYKKNQQTNIKENFLNKISNNDDNCNSNKEIDLNNIFLNKKLLKFDKIKENLIHRISDDLKTELDILFDKKLEIFQEKLGKKIEISMETVKMQTQSFIEIQQKNMELITKINEIISINLQNKDNKKNN